MKTQNRKIRILTASLLILPLFFPQFIRAGNDKGKEVDTTQYNSYHGRVIDENSNAELPFATIGIVGSNIATVSNIEGEFILKVNKYSDFKEMKISYMGYINKIVPLNDFRADNLLTIHLVPSTVEMQAVTIRPGDAADLIDKVMNRTNQNYSTQPVMMKAFYRETIKNRRNYVGISEAVVDIFKAEYNSGLRSDQVKIDKGRKSADVSKMDTVLFKLQGGPAVSLLLDIVKNPYVLLTDEYRKIYDFNISDVVNINNRLHYVMSFNQKSGITDPYYFGRLFIEMESLAITEAEFEMNLENSDAAERLFIQKKPAGMKVTPERALYLTKYSIQDGTWYFSYSRAEVKYKINWDKKLFNSNYTTMSEIAITDRTSASPEKIQNSQRFKRNDILDEVVYSYFDPDFWGKDNVIEPDQSIESAIRKLNRKLNFD